MRPMVLAFGRYLSARLRLWNARRPAKSGPRRLRHVISMSTIGTALDEWRRPRLGATSSWFVDFPPFLRPRHQGPPPCPGFSPLAGHSSSKDATTQTRRLLRLNHEDNMAKRRAGDLPHPLGLWINHKPLSVAYEVHKRTQR
jgi:hypothetical protein